MQDICLYFGQRTFARGNEIFKLLRLKAEERSEDDEEGWDHFH